MIKNKSEDISLVTWRGLVTVHVLIAYSYVFMEWLFFVTKPSFMLFMNNYDKAKIFILSGFIYMLPGFVVILVLAALDIFLKNRAAQALFLIARLIPSITLSFLTFMMIDNFTYTVF